MRIFFLYLLLVFSWSPRAQVAGNTEWWHGKERVLRYHPEGQDIVITNGNRRFTRALYGTHTAFRVETGDLPEFAMYMPGMGGNIKFGLVSGDSSKWLINTDKIRASYRAGSMLYQIEDKMLGKGKLHITVLAMAEAEGMVIRITTDKLTLPVQMVWVYGGASGKRFSRDGDMGPDPESSFYLNPGNCTDNRYSLGDNEFILRYGTGEILSAADRNGNRILPNEKVIPQKVKEQILHGIIPPLADMKIVDATQQSSPIGLYGSGGSGTPAVAGKLAIGDAKDFYFSFAKPDSTKNGSYADLAGQFLKAETARKQLAARIRLETPDPYINTLGGALSIAADAIWEAPSYLHGAVGWRMRLNGWRGPYAGDVLGWHDRARAHFRSYAMSQMTTPDSGRIVADTALHLARQLEKLGTSVFSSGYISRNPGGDLRPHHYDMNLVYIDALLWHIRWTGDTAFIKEIWPVIQRHLAWEKRNFDPDNDGLYDAYAAIWASDALQYSGGAVTHSSAYNYRANKMAAELAVLIGEDPQRYQQEAIKIRSAVDHTLWLEEKGWYAEYKDALGRKDVHPNAGLWTVYHTIDSELPGVFKAWQTLSYVDHHIPHIPIKAKGLPAGFYTLSTSNWMPYAWSLNNVALAELMHTSLANWQTGRRQAAFRLWKSTLLESMYLGGSPGNFQQISTYDAVRGEAYRDFGDPVGMTARSLVQGLFGILPDAIHQELTIKPGFPLDWNKASLQTPDLAFSFTRSGHTDKYTIVPSFQTGLKLLLLLEARGSSATVLVNGKRIPWHNADSTVGAPMMQVEAGIARRYEISILWEGAVPDTLPAQTNLTKSSDINIRFPHAIVQQVYDPQKLVQSAAISGNGLKGSLTQETGNRTAFIQVKQGAFTWWVPLCIEVKEPVGITAPTEQPRNSLEAMITNHTRQTVNGKLTVNNDPAGFTMSLSIPAASGKKITVPARHTIAGTNMLAYTFTGTKGVYTIRQPVINWNVQNGAEQKAETVDISRYFNDKVTNIFKNQYLSPRPSTPTLQLPTQGIGEWTHPLLTALVNDSGLRRLAAGTGHFRLPQGISFSTPADTMVPNIIFTSQWDNYPREVVIPLSGNAMHAYLLMAGSTNPMQSRMVNGVVLVTYEDGSHDTLLLTNPGNWWPIEQDYYEDGYAFTTHAARPVRVHLKTGKIFSALDGPVNLYNGKMIDGGAATVLDIALDPKKKLKELRLQTLSNDVVIGLMALTLQRR